MDHVPATSSASAFGGLWFVFDHAGLSSVHELTVDGSKYTLELATENVRRGMFACVLRKDGLAVAALKTGYVARRRWWQLAAITLGSALLAVVRSAPLASGRNDLSVQTKQERAAS